MPITARPLHGRSGQGSTEGAEVIDLAAWRLAAAQARHPSSETSDAGRSGAPMVLLAERGPRRRQPSRRSVACMITLRAAWESARYAPSEPQFSHAPSSTPHTQRPDQHFRTQVDIRPRMGGPAGCITMTGGVPSHPAPEGEVLRPTLRATARLQGGIL